MEEDDIDAELARLTEKMRPRGEILRTLAWASAHVSLLKRLNLEGVKIHVLESMAHNLRNRSFGHNAARERETLECLLHALSFRRDYSLPHHHYQRRIEGLLNTWGEQLADELKDLVLERSDCLELPSGEALDALATLVFREELKHLARNVQSRRQAGGPAARAPDDLDLLELVAYEATKAQNPSIGTW